MIIVQSNAATGVRSSSNSPQSGDLPLYTFNTPTTGYIGGAPTYEGAVAPVNPNSGPWGDGDFAVYEDRSLMCLGTASDRVFLTGVYSRAVAEVQLPANFSMTTDPTALPQGTVTQNFRNVDSAISTFGTPMLLGMGQVSGQLIVGGTEYYDNAGNAHNYMRFANASNLATGGQAGMFLTTGGRHNAGWTVPVPAEFQASNKLGCTHIQGHGGGIAILSTTVAGVSFYGVNAADYLTATAEQSITATQLADYTVTNDIGMGGNFNTSEMWNYLCHCGGVWFVPGTNTIMGFGANWAGPSIDPSPINTIKYKGPGVVDEEGFGGYGGYFANRPYNYRNWYWLWDVRDLIAVKQGTKAANTVVPYQHGMLPSFTFTDTYRGLSLCGAAFWHPTLERVIFTLRRGVSNLPGAHPSIGKLKLAGIGA